MMNELFPIKKALLFCFSFLCSLTVFSEPLIYTESGYFKDDQGRIVILRGVNATGNAKVPPFRSIVDENQLDPLPNWGINTLRLLFTWEAYQPDNSEIFNSEYLENYKTIIKWAAERDLYVVVDFHQDAFSRYSIKGCGEGFPSWAVHSSIRLAQPRNDENCESWGVQMIYNINHHRAWYHFHRDSEGARTAYLKMVSRVVQALLPYDNVIGYEVMNEPWGTNRELLALYQDVSAVVREHNSHAILFLGPHALLSSGLLKNTMEKPDLTNFAYAPHFYDPFVIMTKMWFGNSVHEPLGEMLNQAQAWGVPLFLGEFGAPATTVAVRGYTKHLYDWLDQYGVSGAHWNYTPNWHPQYKDGWNHEDLSIVDDLGNIRDNFQLRPYPAATSGEPVILRVTEDALEYQWVNNPELGSTKIFVPQSWLQAPFQLSANARGQCEWEIRHLVCDVHNAGSITLTVLRSVASSK